MTPMPIEDEKYRMRQTFRGFQKHFFIPFIKLGVLHPSTSYNKVENIVSVQENLRVTITKTLYLMDRPNITLERVSLNDKLQMVLIYAR